MALSDYERKLLEELEAQLTDSDPQFAEAVSSQPQQISFGISPKNLVWGILVAVLGLTIALVAVTFELVPVGVLGVVVVFVGFWYMTRGSHKSTVKVGKSKSAPRPQRSGDFMSRQQERWQRRQDGRGF